MADDITTIALAGSGDNADHWAKVLRGCEGVQLERLSADADGLLESLSRPGIHAIAFAASTGDLAGAVRRSVLAGRHVLIAGGAALTSKQLLALADLSSRRGRSIVIEDGVVADDQLAFVQKMTSGANPLWRPRSQRALSTGCGADARLDEVATAEIGRVLAVAGGLPSSIAAWSPRIDDESGAAEAVMMTLRFDGGLVARVDVSLVEAAVRRELVIACDARTIVLQPLNREASLLIQAGGRHRGPKRPGPWAETVSEHPVGDRPDRASAVAEFFVDAIRSGRPATTNAEEAARGALTWERARASIARDGEPIAVSPSSQFAGRPNLEVIEGGGHTCAAQEAPRLTLVARQ